MAVTAIKRARQPNRLSPEQVRGVESPATVMLTPIAFPDTARWWAHDNCPMLVGGIKVNAAYGSATPPACMISYGPILIPRNWEEKAFSLVMEYETDHKHAEFAFACYYGCGDPSELSIGKTTMQKGSTNGKQRLAFRMRRVADGKEILRRGELFRCAIEVHRATPLPIYIYGAWLEVGVD